LIQFVWIELVLFKNYLLGGKISGFFRGITITVEYVCTLVGA